jgi:PKD repeat protein
MAQFLATGSLLLSVGTAEAAVKAVNRELGPPVPGPAVRLRRNLALEAAPRSNAMKSEATYEGTAYWKAKLKSEEARGRKQANSAAPKAADESSPDFLRKVSESLYRERLKYRKQDGKPQPLNSTLAAAGWRSLGPTTDAGRIRDYEFTPDGSKLYAATANGGIWMLTRQGDDYGSPVCLTDDLPLLTFGTVAVAPSSPNIVYAATGEQSPNSGSKVQGLGTIKSTDGGATWLFNTRSVTGGVSQLIPSLYSYDLNVNPTNPNDVLLATANGIFRSRDGGETWGVTLPSREDGTRQGVNLARDPRNPNVLWAGLWGGLATTSDGGDNWEVYYENIAQLVGVQANPIRSLVAIAKSNPDRIYWLVASETPQGYSQLGLFVSDDGGRSDFKIALGPPSGQGYPLIAGTQGWSFLGLAVDPTDPNLIIAGGLDTWRSTDGGITWTQIAQWTLPERHPQFCHADVDVITFEPNSKNFWMGTDGGLFRSTDSGRTFIWKNDGIVARMFSSLAQHPTDKYRLYAGSQDNGTMRLSGSSTTAWKKILYGDGYDTAVNYRTPNIVYATNFNNYTQRATDGGESENSFQLTNCPPDGANQAACTLPPVTTFRSRLGMDPDDPNVIYAMTDRIYRTSRGAVDHTDWQPAIGRYFCSDGPSDRPCPEVNKNYASCSSIAVDPKNGNRVAFGTHAGYLIFSLNRLQTWSWIRGISSEINTIVWNPSDPSGLYIGLETAAELVEGSGRHVIWRLTGLGTDQLAAAPADGGIGVPITYSGGSATYYAPVDSLAVSPVDATQMFAGTKYGIFRSTDAGQNWQRFGDDFPATWVSALLFTPDGSLLRAATWGRGMWEINPAGGSPGPTSPPAADFSFSPANPRPGQTVSFSDRSAGGASAWRWDFGDNKTSDIQNPAHVFENPGTYTVTLRASNDAGPSTTTRSIPVSYGDTGTGDVFTYLLPVVLTSSGSGGESFFTTELTMTNRAGRTLNLTFRAKGSGFEGSSTYSLPPGQSIEEDALSFLRNSTGMGLPGGNVVVTLRIEVRNADNLSQFGAQVRVTTPPSPTLRGRGIAGKFGLAFAAVPVGRNATSEAIIYGLLQSPVVSQLGQAGTRSNLACVHAGGGSNNSIDLELTFWDGEKGEAHPSRETRTLSPFEFFQWNQPLSGRGIETGYAVIRKTAGDDQFVCYGVLNDNINSDGAFVPMVINDKAAGTPNAMVPVILDSAGYKSEVTFANRTNRVISGLFAIIPYNDPVPEWGYFQLPAKTQFIVPDIFAGLRDVGFTPRDNPIASVFFQFLDGEFRDSQSDTQPRIPASEGFIGVRTFTEQPEKQSGRFGLAYGYTPAGTAADTEAFIYGLQQTGVRGQEGGTRSNVAVIHALGGNIETLVLEVSYFNAAGNQVGQPVTATLQPGQWQQFSAPLEGLGLTEGFARVRRISGSDQFIAYGVLNDQANSDGSYVPMIIR